jgi:hypothetical protein
MKPVKLFEEEVVGAPRTEAADPNLRRRRRFSKADLALEEIGRFETALKSNDWTVV